MKSPTKKSSLDTSTSFSSPSRHPENLGDTAAFDLATLLGQMQNHENNEETMKCIQCNFTSQRTDSLKVHVKYVHDTSFYTCDQCGRQTKTEEGLEYHIKMRHPENVKDDCPKTAKHQTTEKPRRTTLMISTKNCSSQTQLTDLSIQKLLTKVSQQRLCS